ncbi:amino acid ABC transporter permease [Klebsiella pneumoniae]|uniref:amino acid ABC transporter permease n=1 Tax=Enterobacterales TaxID=91347 RepID=UPI00236294C7|nr:amino acid ABC transporter permease [Klebsiella variicola]
MGSYVLNFDFVFDNLGILLQGIVITLKLTAISGFIGIVVGFFVSLLAMSPYKIIRWPTIAYIEIFRCTPALVQLVWIFYCVPIFLGIYIDPIPMAILALSLNIAAYNAEAYRAAIQAIPSSHHDASIALGLTKRVYTLYVVFPQAFITAIPVLMTNMIGLLQQSALVAIVGIADLMYQAKNLATSSYRPIEVFTVAAVIYFMLSIPFSLLVTHLEKVLNRRIRGRS